MPDPAGAATRRIETSAPECSPIPLNSMSDRMVCSGWALLAKRGNSEQIRTPDYNRVTGRDCGRITTLSTSRGGRFASIFPRLRTAAVLSEHSMRDMEIDTKALLDAAQSQSGWIRTALRRLVEVESPSDDKAAVDAAVALTAPL